MPSQNYPRGSEWRRWDIQIHTPYSYLNNQFTGNFDNYVQELFRRAIKNGIAAIGITDYFCIEGYKRIRTEYLNDMVKMNSLFTPEEIESIKKIFVFPDVELRLSVFVGREASRVNFHILFSDEVKPTDIEENFLHQLQFVEQGHQGSADELRPLTLGNLEALGTRLKAEHTEFEANSPIQVGMTQAAVDHGAVSELLTNKKSIFSGKYLIGVPTDEDLSGIDWNSQDHNIRKVLYQKANFILSSNPNTREFCLGLKHATKEDYLIEFKSFKPCLWSSDAHDYEEMFKPAQDRFVWIKADPTFEGLRQVVFEPDERVHIQRDRPDPKKPYHVIDKVRFIDNTGKNDFPSEYIPINQNLNAIIGGKSTGKSLLLYYTALTADRPSAEKALSFKGSEEMQRYNFESDNDFDFEVVWLDGETMRLKQGSPTGEEGGKRRVIYIPQHYLNQLTEKQIKSRQALNTFVEGIILEDKDANTASIEKKFDLALREKEIRKELENLFSIQVDVAKLQEDLKGLGDEKGVISYSEKLKKEIDGIKKASGLSKDDSKILETLSREVAMLEGQNLNLEKDKQEVQKMAESLQVQLDAAEFLIEGQEYLIDEEVRKTVKEGFAFAANLPKLVTAQKDKIVAFIDLKEKTNREKLQPLREKLMPLLAKVTMEKSLKDKQELLRAEEVKLGDIQSKKNNLAVKRKALDAKKESLLVAYAELYATYDSLRVEFTKVAGRLEDIDLNIVVGFNDTEFSERVVDEFLNKVDLKKLSTTEHSGAEEFEYKYITESHQAFVDDVFRGLLSGKVRTIKGRPITDAIRKLLEGRYYIDYKISYKGDALDAMSPGKKGLVLLRILVQLSNQEWPILLDQPEDDLDNRSVYNDLVAFIKTKKKARQIIVATHNPNLVVGGDAEEVVVANQQGQEISRENVRYRFEYVSGALENTFTDGGATGVLNQMGIREHVCAVLEGGVEAFEKREQKYSLKV